MLRRVKRLEDDGAIVGYRAVIDPSALGINLQALILVQLSEHSRTSLAEFEAVLTPIPAVRACFHVTGRFDMVLVIAARDLHHLAELIRYDIAKVPRVAKLETMLLLTAVKPDGGWPGLPN